MILFKRKKRHFTSVELTPLIDIVFLLLVFFMISSTFLKPVIKLKLPVLASGGQEKQNKVTLSVDEQKKIYLNQKVVSLAALSKFLNQLKPIENITFQADKNTTYDLLVKIMEKLKAAEIKNISLQYQKMK